MHFSAFKLLYALLYSLYFSVIYFGHENCKKNPIFLFKIFILFSFKYFELLNKFNKYF